MDLASLWAEIELEQKWRIDEIRFFDNQVAKLNSKSEQEQFRRVNILLLYAHYEGFCKFAFNFYVNAVNAEGLTCQQVNYSLVAASLDSIFRELKNPESKAVEFKGNLPDDKKLHAFARDKSFLEKVDDFEKKAIDIPDTIVDTESNLKPVVLRKNLYRLGFPHNAFELVEGYISMLLNARNEIAHGAHGIGIILAKYERLRLVTLDVMDRVKRYIMDALSNKSYLRV